jgi:telomerase reverse transcriptase
MFYANLEKKKFQFLKHEDGILLRLIDDFLFISMNKEHAIQFVQAMHDGVDKYLTESNRRSRRVRLQRQQGKKSNKFRRHH